jgi:AcrR family transcriptional regulator
VTEPESRPSPRREELLEAAYAYVLDNGMADLSLRPLATAIGSSPRVLLYLFASKEGLIRALLDRARADELEMLASLRRDRADVVDLATAVAAVWEWLADPRHRPVLVLWVEGYARSLVDPGGPWGRFAEQSVEDWLAVLAACQPARERRTRAARGRRTAALALLRGSLLDLLASGEDERVGRALHEQLDGLRV